MSKKFSKRHRSYKHADKKKGFEYDLSLEQIKALLILPCYYCGDNRQGEDFIRGLDRLDHSRGHDSKNVVICCKKCNFILSNLPQKVKMELREGLRSAFEKGYLDEWDPVPDQAQRQKDKQLEEIEELTRMTEEFGGYCRWSKPCEAAFEYLVETDPASLLKLISSGRLSASELTFAAEIAGRIPQSRDILIKLLAHKDAVVREGAVYGLGLLGNANEELQVCAQRDESPAVRQAATSQLVGSRRAVSEKKEDEK